MSQQSLILDLDTLWELATRMRDTLSSAQIREVIVSLVYLRSKDDALDHLLEGGPKKLAERINSALVDAGITSGRAFDAVPEALLHDVVSTIARSPQTELTSACTALAEGEGKRGGEFYTAPWLSALLAELVAPRPGETAYDPCAGSGSLLVHLHQHARSLGGAPVALHGQEVNEATARLARMNLALHGQPAGHIVTSDALRAPLTDEHGERRTFDIVVADPPLNLDVGVADELAPLFPYGLARTGDLLFMQHAFLSLRPGGRAAVITTAGALSRGGAQAAIRHNLIENNAIEAVIRLAPGLVYTTAIPVCVVVLRRDPRPERRDKLLFIEASECYARTRRTNHLAAVHIAAIRDALADFRDITGFARVVPIDEVVEDDAVLAPRRFINRELAAYRRRLGELHGDAIAPLGDLVDIQRLGRDAEDDGSECVYLPIRGAKLAPTQRFPTLGTQHHVALRPRGERISPSILASFLRSGLGQLGLLAASSGHALRTIAHRDLENLPVPEPPVPKQRTIARCISELDRIEAELGDMRRQLDEGPADLAAIEARVGAYTFADSLDFWIAELPFPLATVLRRYERVASVRDKHDFLIRFFEALAQFIAMFDVSCFHHALEVNQRIPSLGEAAPQIDDKRLLRAGGIGGWTFTHGEVARLVDRDTTIEHLESALDLGTLDLLRTLAQPEVVDLLERVTLLKNRWKSHDAVASETEYERRLQQLDHELATTRRLLGAPLARARLVRAKRGAWHREGDAYVGTVDILRGPDPTFKEQTGIRTTRDALDVRRLYLLSPSGEKPLPLVPLLLMAPTPASERTACYFFSSHKQDEPPRWVSYHYDSEPEARSDDEHVAFASETLHRVFGEVFTK